MNAFLRIVAVAVGLGSWVLVIVGAGVGQSVYTPAPQAGHMATAAQRDLCPEVGTSPLGPRPTSAADGVCGRRTQVGLTE